VLENAALKSLGLNVFKHWQDGLARYLAKRAAPATALSA
jgi:hypothetical protein